jgi:hypothetical protein
MFAWGFSPVTMSRCPGIGAGFSRCGSVREASPAPIHTLAAAALARCGQKCNRVGLLFHSSEREQLSLLVAHTGTESGADRHQAGGHPPWSGGAIFDPKLPLPSVLTRRQILALSLPALILQRANDDI